MGVASLVVAVGLWCTLVAFGSGIPVAQLVWRIARVACRTLGMAVEGEMPDFEFPNEDSENRLGNHVILRCGDIYKDSGKNETSFAL